MRTKISLSDLEKSSIIKRYVDSMFDPSYKEEFLSKIPAFNIFVNSKQIKAPFRSDQVEFLEE